MNETLDEIFGRIYTKLGVDSKKIDAELNDILATLLVKYNVFICQELRNDLSYLRMRLKHEEVSYSMRKSLEQQRTDRMIHYGGFYGPTLYDERSVNWWVDQAERIETQQRIDESIEKWTWRDKKEYKHNGAL